MQAHNLDGTNELCVQGIPARGNRHSRRKLHLLMSTELQVSGFVEGVVIKCPGSTLKCSRR